MDEEQTTENQENGANQTATTGAEATTDTEATVTDKYADLPENDPKRKFRQHKFTLKTSPINPDGSVETSKQKEIEVTLQFPGSRIANILFDNARGANGVLRSSDFLDGVFNRDNQILVSPDNIGWDFFDTHTGINDIYNEAFTFLG